MNREAVARELLKLAKALIGAHRGKMTEEDYEEMAAAIDGYIKKYGKDLVMRYRRKLEDDPKVRDADERFRWDLLNAAQKTMKFDIRRLYRYLNDRHIDTALKFYVKSRRLS